MNIRADRWISKLALTSLLMLTASSAVIAQQTDAWQVMARALESDVANARENNIRLSVGVAGLAGSHQGRMTFVGSSEPYPPASTIKMLLIATLMKQVDAGILSLQDTATVEQNDIVGGYGDIQHEPVPNEVSLERLAKLTVTISDNTATNVLVDVVGYEAMQSLADELRLETMQFGRKMFESPMPPEKQNYITAKDTIMLLKAIYDGTFLTEEARRQIIAWMSAQTVTTKIAAGVPDGVPIAHKTGENASVTHDLGYLLWPENEVAITIFADSEISDDFDTVQSTVNPVVAHVAQVIYEHLNPTVSQ